MVRTLATTTSRSPAAWHNSNVVGTGTVFRLAALAFVASVVTSCGTRSETRAGPFPVDSGSDTRPSDDAGPASPDANAGSADVTKERMSEEEWQRITAPIEGPHEIEERSRLVCPTPPVAPEYRIIPPVYCAWHSNPDAPMDQVKFCDVQSYCQGHADCAALPFGRCRGELEAFCSYPNASPSACYNDTECVGPPRGACLPPDERNTLFCYPTGRCEKQPWRCTYRTEPRCASDADCTTAPGGWCQKRILHPHCEAQGCLVDGDCGAGQRCACSRPANECVPADCMTDGDCPGGEHCLLETECFRKALGYHCSTPLDTCRAQADCGASYCAFVGRWQCSSTPCIPTMKVGERR